MTRQAAEAEMTGATPESAPTTATTASAPPGDLRPEVVSTIKELLFAPYEGGGATMQAKERTGSQERSSKLEVSDAAIGASHTSRDGNAQQTTGVRLTDAQGLSVSHTRQLVTDDRKPVAGVGGGASVKLTDGGAALSAQTSVSVGGVMVSKGGGFEVSAKVVPPPRGQKGPWRVVWSRRLDESGGAGVQGGTMGVQAGKTESTTKHGEVPFATEAEAQAFAEQGATYISMATPAPRDASMARTMAVGETRGESTADKTTGGLTAASGAASASASVSHTASKGYQVARVGKDQFQVTLSVGELRAAGGNIGAPLVSFGIDGSVDENETLTIAVDLSTPKGAETYDDLIEHRRLRRGMNVVARSWSQTERSGKKMDMPLVHSKVESVVERQVLESGGHKTESAKGSEVEALTVGAFGWETGHHRADAGLKVIEKDDQERAYLVEASVDSTDGRLSHEALAQATGTYTDVQRAHRSSGKWSIGAEVSEADMDAFVKIATSDRFQRGELGMRAGVADDLARALKQAKSSDERREALARFTADGGPRALEVIEHRIGEARGEPDFHFEHDLGLAGDANFTGTAGRLALAEEMGELRARFEQAAGDPAALREVATACSRLEAREGGRRTAIADRERYTDLPDQLRGRELMRSDGTLSQIAALRKQAEVGVVARELPDLAAEEGALTEAEERYKKQTRELHNPHGTAPAGYWREAAETRALTRQARLLYESAGQMRKAIDGARSALVAGSGDAAQLRAQVQNVRELYERAGVTQEAAVQRLYSDNGVRR